jgi:FkbM family methyltransferase
MRTAKKLLQSLLAITGYQLISNDRLDDLVIRSDSAERLPYLLAVAAEDSDRLADLIGDCQSQLGQELFVLRALDWKRNGYFVEFGAANGKLLSNTWLLEKRFDWNGILAEPARGWHRALAASGRRAAIDYDCVWSRSGATLQFAENPAAELSTLLPHYLRNEPQRNTAWHYPVRTISLMDLLEKHGAPAEIDYLSIDTEGSELDILSTFDFSRYSFRIITVEHNYAPNREALHALLNGHGYQRRCEHLSYFDDWYVLGD